MDGWFWRKAERRMAWKVEAEEPKNKKHKKSNQDKTTKKTIRAIKWHLNCQVKPEREKQGGHLPKCCRKARLALPH